jgi:hypothetical protein
LVASNRMETLLVSKKLPYALPSLQIDMLWHERDARDPVHKWMRSALPELTSMDTRLSGQQVETAGSEQPAVIKQFSLAV